MKKWKKIFISHYCQNCVKPTIESIPNQVIEYGYTLTVSCSATGTPTPNIIWIRDGKSVNVADKSVTVETFERSPGHVESILEINNLILIDTGEYWCYAENALGLAKEKFILKVQQNNTTDEKVMADELIPCSDEYKDYCLNGGQCYAYKSERVSFQCRCIDHYFGDRCHFHTDGLYGIYSLSRAYSESRGYDIQSMLHELATTLTLRGVFFTLFGASISVLTFYGIWKCQQRSMYRRHLKKRNKSSSKHNLQMKSTHPVTNSNHGSRIVNGINDSTDPFLLSDFHKREQTIDTVPIQEEYIGHTTDGYILSTTNLFNTSSYVNQSQNCINDAINDLKSTNHMNPQQLHDHSRNEIPIGYRPSSTLDQYSDKPHKSENRIILHNRPYESDWSARRLTSQKPASVRDRLPVLAEGSNLDLNIDRYPDYTNSMNNINRLGRDREIPVNMISSASSFIQTNT
ncbi:Pro-neuregulin-2, membrane-bound isoform 2 [Schistosoma japonicum]|uniref:Pro-neuregulin-2, membrane-bound isoform 2 n=1 Tax=Schistosoma japonicum TaxID=6182 RepID=A0A4Z2CXE6_SCHJA|nr:Pro-neuregulin-2, membrane-bound isoform 2 [Schistosoma japonicum]